ncbi:MAG: hypothetical protein ACM3PY_14380 [Omnitrophica WOR_2 bacterium]
MDNRSRTASHSSSVSTVVSFAMDGKPADVHTGILIYLQDIILFFLDNAIGKPGFVCST